MSSKINKSAVIIGSGVAGLTTAKLLGLNGFDVTVVETSSKIGGHVSDWSCKATTECQVCHCCSISDVIADVNELPIRFLPNCELESVTRDSAGAITEINVFQNTTGTISQIQTNALVLSTGFDIYNPAEKILWGYGTMNGVMTLQELDELMRNDRLDELGSLEEIRRIAFFQCVGSRDKSTGANYCSQYCCKTALRNAIKIKMERPEWRLSVFYIDLQVNGKYASTLLGNAQELEIVLAQGVPGEIEPTPDGKLGVIREKDGLNVREEFDRVILSTGIRPASSSARLSEITGVGLDEHGFFQKLNSLDPCRTSVSGVYLSGACSGPMDIETTSQNAAATASNIIHDLSGCKKV